MRNMINLPSLVMAWFINLFTPPPLDSMTRSQKVGRIFLITITLVVNSILFAMVGASLIFLLERGTAMLNSVPALMEGLVIILTSIFVNALCVSVLLQIKKADRKLMAD